MHVSKKANFREKLKFNLSFWTLSRSVQYKVTKANHITSQGNINS